MSRAWRPLAMAAVTAAIGAVMLSPVTPLNRSRTCWLSMM
jgi:hypothetical protein